MAVGGNKGVTATDTNNMAVAAKGTITEGEERKDMIGTMGEPCMTEPCKSEPCKSETCRARPWRMDLKMGGPVAPFGLGHRRSLQQFQSAIGVNFFDRTVESRSFATTDDTHRRDNNMDVDDGGLVVAFADDDDSEMFNLLFQISTNEAANAASAEDHIFQSIPQKVVSSGDDEGDEEGTDAPKQRQHQHTKTALPTIPSSSLPSSSSSSSLPIDSNRNATTLLALNIVKQYLSTK